MNVFPRYHPTRPGPPRTKQPLIVDYCPLTFRYQQASASARTCCLGTATARFWNALLWNFYNDLKFNQLSSQSARATPATVKGFEWLVCVDGECISVYVCVCEYFITQGDMGPTHRPPDPVNPVSARPPEEKNDNNTMRSIALDSPPSIEILQTLWWGKLVQSGSVMVDGICALIRDKVKTSFKCVRNYSFMCKHCYNNFQQGHRDIIVCIL